MDLKRQLDEVGWELLDVLYDLNYYYDNGETIEGERDPEYLDMLTREITELCNENLRL